MFTIDYTPYKLLDWVNQYKNIISESYSRRRLGFSLEILYEYDSFWDGLSSNPKAIYLLEKNLDKIDWSLLSRNPNGISLLQQNLHRVNWKDLSSNPNAIDLLEQNPDKIDWDMLSKNKNAISLLEQNPDKIV